MSSVALKEGQDPRPDEGRAEPFAGRKGSAQAGAGGPGIAWRWLTAILLAIAGLPLLWGGAQLIRVHGSPYYLTAGLALCAVAVLAARGSRWSGRAYLGFLLATLVWAVAEVGADPWGLAARLGLFLGLGLLFVIPAWWRSNARAPLAAGELAVLAALVAGAFLMSRPPMPGGPAGATEAATDWPAWGNGPGGARLAEASQITPKNVGRLEVAWIHRNGELPRPGEGPPRIFSFQAVPVKVGDNLYFCTGHDTVQSVDATTGKERWRFDPKVDTTNEYIMACRGVAYDAPPAAAATSCPRRVYLGTFDGRLLALNADTGRPCADFGQGGAVDLKTHMGVIPPGFHYITSPPTVLDGNVVVGGGIVDNFSTDEPSGVIRSYDAVTGALRWAWDMGAPDRIGAPEGGGVYTRGTPNSWSIGSADPALGLIYLPMGGSTPDYYGAQRRPFDEKYATSVVALDVRTGRPRWNFQAVHHDLWDYDNPSQPVLLDLKTPQGVRPALVLATKTGQIFVLDRRDGTPILPVTERPAPQAGAVPGERPSPTQPWSAISMTPPPLTEAAMWGVTPYDQLWCRLRFKQSNYAGPYSPPTLHGSIQMPGGMGITEWGGVAVDPHAGRVVVNSSAVPYFTMMLRRSAEMAPTLKEPMASSARAVPGQTPKSGHVEMWGPQVGTPYLQLMRPFLGPLGTPCNVPPWGRLTAFDLGTGHKLWDRPIGSARDSGPLGVSSQLPFLIGTPTLGGPTLTRAGLVFHAGTLDRYLRAYSAETGEELWRARLPAGGQSNPVSYVGRDGRQYVVIAAGGHGGLKTKAGDYLVAFALPAKPN